MGKVGSDVAFERTQQWRQLPKYREDTRRKIALTTHLVSNYRLKRGARSGSKTSLSGMATRPSAVRMIPSVAVAHPVAETRHPRCFHGSITQMLGTPNCR